METTPKYLNLVLKDHYYQMTGEHGKMYELRKPTKWILSRLMDSKTGKRKHYDFVELCSGYKSNRQKKYARFAAGRF